MPLTPWRVARREVLFRHRILALERRRLERGDAEREALVVTSPDWVNVVALTAEERVLLVRQWRFGVDGPTLEIPGGMVDDGEDGRAAAGRELVEETGHRAGRLERLGVLEPNPAIQANRLETWLATDLERVRDRPLGAGDEEIELVTAPLGEIPGMIADGEIRHALVVAGFHLLDLHRRPTLASGGDRGSAG